MSDQIIARPELTAEYLRSILHYEPATGIFTRKVSTSNRTKVGDVAGSPNNEGYLNISGLSRKVKAHRLAWLYVHGVWPKEHLDHINKVRHDNRISNLREATNQQNMQNASTRTDSISRQAGVVWWKRDSNWRARIRHNYKDIHLGYFTTIEEAVAARKAAEKLYWSDTYIAESTPV